MVTKSLVSLVLCLGFTGEAVAGGEDFQSFEGDCTGFDSESQTYPSGTLCTVKLRSSPCYGDISALPDGIDAYVARKVGSRWVRVTPITHYDACAEESENGVNRRMKFRVANTAVFSLFVDAKGDGQPPYREPVLAPFTSSNGKTFRIPVR